MLKEAGQFFQGDQIYWIWSCTCCPCYSIEHTLQGFFQWKALTKIVGVGSFALKIQHHNSLFHFQHHLEVCQFCFWGGTWTLSYRWHEMGLKKSSQICHVGHSSFMWVLGNKSILGPWVAWFPDTTLNQSLLFWAALYECLQASW
jgi:hypothetical protein